MTKKKYDRDWLYEEYIIKNRTAKEIAKDLDVEPFTVYMIMRRYSIRKNSDINITKEWLEEEWIKKKRTQEDIAKEIGISEVTLRNRIWEVGLDRFNNDNRDFKLNKKRGYIQCQGGLAKHRIIIQEKIGRPLTRKERVHHINSIKTDNRISNLVVCQNLSEHRQIHNSLQHLLPELLEMKIIEFDFEKKIYKIKKKI